MEFHTNWMRVYSAQLGELTSNLIVDISGHSRPPSRSAPQATILFSHKRKSRFAEDLDLGVLAAATAFPGADRRQIFTFSVKQLTAAVQRLGSPSRRSQIPSCRYAPFSLAR